MKKNFPFTAVGAFCLLAGTYLFFVKNNCNASPTQTMYYSDSCTKQTVFKLEDSMSENQMRKTKEYFLSKKGICTIDIANQARTLTVISWKIIDEASINDLFYSTRNLYFPTEQ